MIISIALDRSVNNRFFKCLDKLANKYQLKLIAGNFFVSEFQPCVEAAYATLDSPPPQYLSKAAEAANLPEDPFATAVRAAALADATGQAQVRHGQGQKAVEDSSGNDNDKTSFA